MKRTSLFIVLIAGLAALAGAALVGHAAIAEDPPPQRFVYIEAEGRLPALESFASNSTGTERQAIARKQGNCCGVNWSSRAQVLFENFTPGARMTLRIEIPEGATYSVAAVFSRAPNFGIYEFSIDGRRIGERQDGYAPVVERSAPVDLGAVELAEGSHTLTLTVVDKNPLSTNFFAGLDYLELRSIPGDADPAPPAAAGGPAGAPPPVAPPQPAASRARSRAACTPLNGFRSTSARPRGRGVALGFRRAQNRPVQVDVFQQSAGRRVLGERLVARYAGRKAGFVWNGRANRPGRRVTDGVYFVRYRMAVGGGRADVRRVTLLREGGRFRVRPSFYRRDTCGLLRSFKLTRPVFGGRANTELHATYQLNEPGTVEVEVLRGTRRIRRVAAVERRAGQAYRVRLDAEGLPRGDYRVRVRVRSGTATQTGVLTARRL